MNNNNILTLSCKWYINTFKNLPIIVLINIACLKQSIFLINHIRLKTLTFSRKLWLKKIRNKIYFNFDIGVTSS